MDRQGNIPGISLCIQARRSPVIKDTFATSTRLSSCIKTWAMPRDREYYGAVMYEDYADIENYCLQSGLGASIHLLRPLYPRWRHQLVANGVNRVSMFDTLASNLMIEFIRDAMPRPDQDRKAMHDHRNLLWATGAPMLRERGWKV